MQGGIIPLTSASAPTERQWWVVDDPDDEINCEQVKEPLEAALEEGVYERWDAKTRHDLLSLLYRTVRVLEALQERDKK